MGEAAKHEPPVRGSVAARLHARGRPAGDADGPPAARRASRRRVTFPRTTLVRQVDTRNDYLADVTAELHDLRGDHAYADCLLPDSYVASQRLAESLLEAGSLGVVYPSVRRRRGTCVACFRPALVGNVRRDLSYRF